MKKMTPKDLLTPKNLLGALAIGVIMASLIFVGTQLFVKADPPPPPPPVVYTDINNGIAGGNSMLKVQFSGTLGDQVEDGAIACPGGYPGGAICYNLAGITSLTGTGLTGGITTSNITALLRADAVGGKDKNVLVIFDTPNIITDIVAGVSIGIAENFGGLIAPPEVKTSFIPLPLADVIYASANAQFGGKSTLTVSFIETLGDQVEDGKVDCPGGYPEGAICYNPAGITTLGGAGWGVGIELDDITAIARGDVFGATNKDLIVAFNAPDVIANLQDVSVTFAQNFGGINQNIRIFTSFIVPASPIPTSINGDITYVGADPNNGNNSTLMVTFNNGLSAVNTVACPEGIDNATCYNPSGITASSGITGNAIAMIAGNATPNVLSVVYDAADVIADLQNASITFNGFGGITGPIVGTGFALPVIPTPTAIVGNITYIGASPQNGNNSTLMVSFDQGLSATNAIACPEGVLNSKCYNVSGITASSGITGNATTMIAADASPTILNISFDAADVIADLQNASITFNGFGGIANPIVSTNFALPVIPAPTAINGDITYIGADPNNGNNSTLMVTFNQNLLVADTVACPEGVDNATCYNPSGITASSGITGNATTMIRADASQSILQVSFDAADVIADLQNASITFNGFGGIANPIVSTNFALPVIPAPTAINGNITYVGANPTNGNNSTLMVSFNQGLSAANAIACPEGVLNSKCYNVSGITASSGITGNATTMIAADASPSVLNISFDAANVIADLQNASITFNGFGGIANPIVSTNFALPVVPAPTAIVGNITYTGTDPTNGNNSTLMVVFDQGLSAANAIACPEGVLNSKCYNVSGITASSGITGNATTMIAADASPTILNITFDAANVISDLQSASITFNGFGGIANPIAGTAFMPPAVPTPTSINGNITYAGVDPDNGNNSTLAVTFNNSLSLTNKITCPEGILNANCYNPSGITASSGITGNATAMFSPTATPTKLNIAYDAANVIADLQNASITFNGFGGITSPIVGTAFAAPVIPAPTEVVGSITYVAQAMALNNGNSILTATFNQALASSEFSCPEYAPEGAVCYNTGGITDMWGWGLSEGVSKNDITVMFRGDVVGGTTSQLVIVFNRPNILNELQGVFIGFNGFGGITNGINADSFSDTQSITCTDNNGACNLNGENAAVLLDEWEGGIQIDGAYNFTMEISLAMEQTIEMVRIEHDSSAVGGEYMWLGELYYKDGEDWVKFADITNGSGGNSGTAQRIIEVSGFDPITTDKLRIVDKENDHDIAAWYPSYFSWTTSEPEEMFHIQDDQFVYMEKMDPPPFSNVSDELEQLYLVYSGPLDASTVITDNITVSANGSTVNTTPSFDSNSNTLVIDLDESIQGEESLRIQIQNVTAANGEPVWTEDFTYYLEDTSPSAPVVTATSIQNGASGVDTIQSEIMIQFDDPLALPISGSGVTISPTLNSNYYYDPDDFAIHIFPYDQLTSGTGYTITYGPAVDTSGNAIAGLYGNNIGTGSLSFSTGSANTTEPQLTWVDFFSDHILVGYNVPLTNAATQATNWTMACDGQSISLSSASITNNAENYHFELILPSEIENPDQYSSCTLSLSKINVKGMNGVAFTGSNNALTNSFMEEFDYAFDEGDDWQFGMCMESDCTEADKWMDPMMMGWSPIEFNPSSMMEGQASQETFVGVPLMQSVSTGDSLVVTLPSGSSINTDNLEIFGDDINGPSGANLSGIYYPDAAVMVTNTSYSATNKKLTLTLGIDIDNDGSADSNASTDGGDYLEFIFAGFINGDATGWDFTTGNGGAYASFSTKESTGRFIEENIGQSTPYSVTEGGAGGISGTVLKSGTNTGVEDVRIMLDSWQTGMMETATDANGDYTFSSLPTGDYWVFVEPDKEVGGYIVTASTDSIFLTDGAPSATDVDFTVQEGNKTVTVTLGHSGVGTDGTMKAFVDAFNFTNNMFTGKEVLLDADGSTEVELTLVTGEWEINMGYFQEFDFMDGDMMGGHNDFMIPQGQRLMVEEDSENLTVTIGLASSDSSISGTVTDKSGNAVANAEVYIYRPDGMMGDRHTNADDSGRFTINLSGGYSYTIGTFLPGAPGFYEESIYVETGETISNYAMVIDVPSLVISGTVTGDNKEAWIDAFNDQTGEFVGTSSDPNTGMYSLRVNANSSYTIQAFSYTGQLDASGAYAQNGHNLVNVLEANISDVNFAFDSESYGTISGSVNPIEGGATVCAESYFTNSGNPSGKWSCSTTNDSGEFSISTEKNSGDERYQVFSFSGTYGDRPPLTDIDISSTNATGKVISAAGNTYEITLSIDGIPAGTDELFFDAFNPITWNGIGFDIRGFSNGDAERTFYLPEGTYETWLFAPGMPEQYSNVTISGDTTLEFDLGDASADMSVFTVTVVDSLGNPKADAWVEVFEPSTGMFVGEVTDADGEAEIKITSTNGLQIRADHPDYTNNNVTLSRAEAESLTELEIELGSQQTSSVTFNLSNATSTVWIDLTNGEFWNGAPTNDSGVATISVPENMENMSAYLFSETGETYEIEPSNSALLQLLGLDGGIDSGDTVNINFNSFDNAESYMENLLNDVPKSASFIPQQGTSIDDVANTGVELALDANSISNESGQYSARIKTVANIPQNETLTTQGLIGKEITFYDDESTLVTDISGDYELSLTFTKDELEGLKGNKFNSFDDLDNMQIGYWDNSANSYVAENTTKYAFVKEEAGDSWESVTFSTMTDNIESDASYYNDWKIELECTADHATIFSPIVGSDSTPPAAPTGLSGTALNTTTVSLDWADNAEADLLEYEVFRHTSSPVPFGQANEAYQINASAVTSSAFIDTTVSIGTYCYAITAVDDSGNESTTAPETCVTVSAAGDTEEVVITTGGGAAGGSSDDDDDDEVVEEDLTTDDETPEPELYDDEELVAIPEEAVEPATDYEGHWAEQYITAVIEAGIAEGTGESTFEPNREVTRAELTKMVLNALDYETEESIEESSFTDVDTAEWYAPYVEKAYEVGIIQGYANGEFKPSEPVNRAEAMKILIGGYFGGVEFNYETTDEIPFPDVELDAWYAGYIMYAYTNGIIGGYEDGTFGPSNSMTRGEFSKVVTNLVGL